MWKELAVNEARARIKIVEIQTELPQDGDSVDPRTDTQMRYALDVTRDERTREWLARLQLGHQESVQV